MLVKRKRNPYTIGGNINYCSNYENMYRNFSKTQTRISYYPDTTPGHIYEGMKVRSQEIYLHIHVYISTFHNSQTMVSAWVFINWWMNKENVVDIHDRVLVTIKRNEITSFARKWMELEIIMLNKADWKRKKISFSLSYDESIHLKMTQCKIWGLFGGGTRKKSEGDRVWRRSEWVQITSYACMKIK
jgi:hypothetical protein